MARRTTAKATVTMSVEDMIGPIDEEKALRRAQEKNARLVQLAVQIRADAEVGKAGHEDTGQRNRGEYPGSMVHWYEARVGANGDLILDNPTDRAAFFEFGTDPHEIWASGLFEAGRGTPARGSRGQFTKGAQALAFPWMGGFFIGEMVDHPGQDANPVMMDTMEAMLPEMGENVLDELVEEIVRG